MMRSLVLTLVALGWTMPLAAQAFQFGTIGVGTNTRAIVTADFNGDGHLDFAAANNGAPSDVAIFLGNGDGTFVFGGRVVVAPGAFGIASADFNHDGRNDLVVTSADSGVVSILMWTSGGFTVRKTLHSPGGDPRSVVSADFNRDGNPDIAYASFACGCVEVWVSDRTGSNWNMVGSFKTGAGAHGLAVADVDLDGALDLVATNASANSVSVLYGEDNGLFLPGPTMMTQVDPRSVAIADFNQDGLPDLAVLNTGSGSISLFTGVRAQPSENGPIPAPFARRTLSCGCAAGRFPFTSPRDIAAVELNFDGRIDLAVASYGDDTVYVIANLTSGTPITAAIKDTGAGPRSLAWGDFDEDGRLDLLSGDQKIGAVSVLLNREERRPHFR